MIVNNHFMLVKPVKPYQKMPNPLVAQCCFSIQRRSGAAWSVGDEIECGLTVSASDSPQGSC